MNMIYIGSDHEGFQLKETVKSYLKSLGYEFIDEGPETLVPGDDYPVFAKKVCNVIKDGDKGILICDTGIGMSIVANRFKHIRAALCGSIFDAVRAREHNDANVLVMGAKTTELDTVRTIVKVFFDTEFSNEERHIRRIHEID